MTRPTWLWIALLVSLPVTTFPLLAGFFGGETPVSPLGLIPLGILTVIWLVPYLVRGGKVPGLAGPLLGFAVVALVSVAAANFLPLLPYKGQVPPAREARALLTIGIGLAFYLTSSILPNTPQGQRSSLRAIYVGGVFALAWASIQGWVAMSGADMCL